MIYKLNYLDKETAIADLIAKGVYVEQIFEEETSLVYGDGVQAIVEIGKIILEQGTYDENLNEITPPVIAEGYHFDVMSIQEIDFGSNEIQVNNPKHNFLGQ